MRQKRLQYLVEAYFDNSLNKDELVELNAWFHSVNLEGGDFQAWINESGGEKELSEKLYAKFTEKITYQKRKPSVRQIYSASAAAAVIAGVVLSAIIFTTKNNPIPTKAYQKPTPEIIKPGRDKAVLTLADGRRITLDEAGIGKLDSHNGINIKKAAGGQLIYTITALPESNSILELNASNTIETPRGGQYQVILQDGSKVWLNAQTKLTYPIRFSGTQRNVKLTGEAYFEVAKSTSQKFVVQSDNQLVEVLGTHFNINAYPDEAVKSTTLVEGSVKISNINNNLSTLLKPGQQAKLTNTLDVKYIDTEPVIAWKDGLISFKSSDIKSIMKQVSRWYDVDVVYQGDISPRVFTGEVSRKSELSELLKILELSNIHFKVEGRKIMVLP